jgi:hypothetical protein
MMMSTPKAPLQTNRANPNGTAVAKTPKACLFNLEETYETRKKTDHEFMNWWLGTLLIAPVTLFLYPQYRFYRNIARRDSHFAKTHQFYVGVAETIHAIAKDQGNTAVDTDLRNMNQLLNKPETKKLFKPIHWWLYLAIAFVGGGIAAGLSAVIAPMLFPTANTEQVSVYISGISMVLQLPIMIYGIMIYTSLMKNHATLEQFEVSCLQKTKTMLLDLGFDKARTLAYEPQCKPRNFWIHFALTFVTFGLNWLYVDFRLITEPVKRFKEANKVQYEVLQGLKQIFNKNLQRANEVQGHLSTDQSRSVVSTEEPRV